MLFRLAILKACILMLLACLSLNGVAAQTDLNEKQSQRAENLYGQLRCVVCQNQSILDSDADVAKDLREIVSEQIASGRSDAEIKSFLVDRYGEFILLRPVFSAHTLVLWIAPLLFVLAGIYGMWRLNQRKSKPESAAPLSEDEERRLNDLLDDYERSSR